MKIKDLQEKRMKCIADARAILDAAEKDNRVGKLNAEEERQWNAHLDEQEELRKHIDREKKLSTVEGELDSIDREYERGQERKIEKAATKTSEKDSLIRSAIPEMDTPEYRKAFQKYLVTGGTSSLSAEEARSLSQGSSPEGGFFVPTQEFVNTLIKFVDDAVFMRQKAVKHQLAKAVSLGIPSWDTDPSDADWTTEIGTGSLDSSMRTGKRELSPKPLAKRVKLSLTLLRNSAIPVDTLVLQRLAYKFGVTEEKAFLTGGGATDPLGVLTASNNGISTGRDISTDNTTIAPTFDGLKNAKYFLKAQYWNSAEWMFHRDVVKLLAKIKDGEGRYVWADGVVGTEPGTLMGFPLNVSEYMPNTLTTGKYVGILGDFSFYHIADSLQFGIQRLNELYAETNQVGFIGRLETDGMPVLEEAFVRVKLA
jgi:HK97 family phage major capsid protein